MSADRTAWGGLVIAGMPLALPLEALREVLPCRGLAPLPCAQPDVIGGLDVRGVSVPVIELAPMFGRVAAPADTDCVVLVVHRGRLLGLRAAAVSGVFHPEPGSFAAVQAHSGPALLLAGSVRRGQPAQLVHVLSIDALAALPGIPWVDDPEPQRQAWSGDERDGDTGNAGPAAADDARSLLLLRCGRQMLAVDAMAVHATMWEPRVEPSPLARGTCRGVLAFDGRRIGALDLAALCGFGATVDGGARHALVVRLAEGLVALLVDSVLEIVRVPAAAIVPLTALGLPRPQLCGGLLAADDAARHGSQRQDFIVLDATALCAQDDVAAIAATNTDIGRAAGASTDARTGAAASHPGDDGRQGRALITLRLPPEIAVPVDEVKEILHYGDQDAAFGDDNVLRRLQVVRGRSMPVLCLARLLRLPVGPRAASAAVLVVETRGQWLGFGVPALDSIETATWEQTLPGPLPCIDPRIAQVFGRRNIATVGRGSAARTVPVLSLRALADALASQRDLLAA